MNHQAVSPRLLILRTDIKTKKKVKIIKPIFNHHASIKNWWVDTEDIDNVLRIESLNGIDENDVINLLKVCGFYGEPLKD